MKHWIDFIRDIPEEEYHNLIDDYNILSQTGMMSEDSILRQYTEDWITNVGIYQSNITVAKDIIFDILMLSFYNK